jgi:hypothetical protein
MYVGAVLFINGLMLLGRVDPKGAGVFNLFVGAMQVITPLYLIFTANGDMWSIFNASGIFLFGFTYLYVGIANLANLSTVGIGWYSLWVAILAVGYSFVSFAYFGDEKFGIIWLMWAFLWTLFFLLLGLKREIGIFTGWVTLIESWITAAIPAFLSLTGVWDRVTSVITWGMTILTVIVYIILFFAVRIPSHQQNMGAGGT